MAEVKQVTFPVTGMTCANCAAAIERNVRKLPGVDIANVNLASEKLTVAFDPTQLDEQGIITRSSTSVTASRPAKSNCPSPVCGIIPTR